MKKKAALLILIVILLAVSTGAVTAARRADIFHILAEPNDTYYMLCVAGHWEVQVNGSDSIRPVCVPNGENHDR